MATGRSRRQRSDRSYSSNARFPGSREGSGYGSCNRFFGAAKISGDTIKLGPLASSRMACPEAVMNQESKYLGALQAAERFEWKDSHLLIYCKDFEKPL